MQQPWAPAQIAAAAGSELPAAQPPGWPAVGCRRVAGTCETSHGGPWARGACCCRCGCLVWRGACQGTAAPATRCAEGSRRQWGAWRELQGGREEGLAATCRAGVEGRTAPAHTRIWPPHLPGHSRSLLCWAIHWAGPLCSAAARFWLHSGGLLPLTAACRPCCALQLLVAAAASATMAWRVPHMWPTESCCWSEVGPQRQPNCHRSCCCVLPPLSMACCHRCQWHGSTKLQRRHWCAAWRCHLLVHRRRARRAARHRRSS